MRPKYLLVSLFLLLNLVTAAVADSWPNKPVRVVVPWPPGGATDVVARVVSDQMSKGLRQPFVIENRPGASGTIGASVVARSEPDGYTVLITSSSYTTSAATIRGLSFAPSDLSGVISLGGMPLVLVTSPAKGYKTTHELVADAKARPASVTYAASTASASEFLTEDFQRSAGINLVGVPYKGAPEALPDIVAGRVDVYFSPLLPALPLLVDRKLIALAVASSTRSSILPEVPTLREQSFGKLDYNLWIGMFVAAKTPRSISDTLYREARRSIQMPRIKQKLASLGIEPMPMSQEEFELRVQREIATNLTLKKGNRSSQSH